MSRAVPIVQSWRVRYYNGGTLLACVTVMAPNRRFARWNARDQLMRAGTWLAVWRAATRDTVALAPRD